MYPPLLVLIGLTGAGKSTVAALLEQSGLARRAKRITTRPHREDDDPNLVQIVKTIKVTKFDFITYGWANSVYCYPTDEIQEIRRLGLMPVVELATFTDAKRIVSLLPPGIIILVDRPLSEETIRATGLSRKMDEQAINDRVQSFYEDLNEINVNREKVHYTLFNTGDLSFLNLKVSDLLNDIDGR